jgi:hypothetical protein
MAKSLGLFLEPFGAQERHQQIDEQQERDKRRQQDHDSSLSNLVAREHESEHEAQRHKAQRQQCG